MQGEPPITELCAGHGNEDIHTEWVTSRIRVRGSRSLIAPCLKQPDGCTVCGYEGSRAIASFAKKLTRQQRLRLRCWRNPHTGEYTALGETCIRKLLHRIDADQ